MGFYDTIKKALTDTVDVVIDKTTTQAQKSRLRIVMRNEAKLTNDAYIELGKYLYENCRENATEDIESICRRIDISKERMKRAQDKYREVLQEELVNREITKNEVKENIQKMKEPIIAKAKDTAGKVSELKDAAKEKASEIKEKIPTAGVGVSVGYGEVTHDKDDNVIIAEKIFDNAVEDAVETVVNSDDEATVKDAIEAAVNKSVTISVNDEIAHRAAEVEEAEDEIINEVSPTEIYSYSSTTPTEAAETTDSTETQEFQRAMAVDILTEEDYEAESPEVKPYTAPTALDKAKKLKGIIIDNSEIADPND